MLELIGNSRCDDVIGANIYGTGKVAFINQVDFIINIGRHIFVEEIRRTNVDILNHVLVAVAAQISPSISGKRVMGASRSRIDIVPLLQNFVLC